MNVKVSQNSLNLFLTFSFHEENVLSILFIFLFDVLIAKDFNFLGTALGSETECELGALSELTVGVYLATHLFNHPLTNRQSQASALLIPHRIFIQLAEINKKL